jgi:hypothetical protein
MSVRQFAIDDQINILVSKRSSSRRIRLTVSTEGQVKVSIPKWVPYSAAISFAKSKQDWIKKKIPETTILSPGRQIGKNHRLVFKPTDKKTITSRLSDLEAIVFYPNQLDIGDPKVQQAAKRIIKRALRVQAERLLPIRVKELADKHGFKYGDLYIKCLKTRWGSCDSSKNITLNLYLMELPWELIDYVIMHELNHTEIMQHGPKFWQALEGRLPKCLELKKQIKSYPTTV